MQELRIERIVIEKDVLGVCVLPERGYRFTVVDNDSIASVEIPDHALDGVRKLLGGGRETIERLRVLGPLDTSAA